MGWGNIGLSWTRYARSVPTRNCERCHLDFPDAEESCPHCRDMADHELQSFQRELETKKKNSTRIFIAFIAALLLYVVIVLFVLPVYLQ